LHNVKSIVFIIDVPRFSKFANSSRFTNLLTFLFIFLFNFMRYIFRIGSARFWHPAIPVARQRTSEAMRWNTKTSCQQEQT